MKPHLRKAGGFWYCWTFRRLAEVLPSCYAMGKGATPAAALADWRAKCEKAAL